MKPPSVPTEAPRGGFASPVRVRVLIDLARLPPSVPALQAHGMKYIAHRRYFYNYNLAFQA